MIPVVAPGYHRTDPPSTGMTLLQNFVMYVGFLFWLFQGCVYVMIHPNHVFENFFFLFLFSITCCMQVRQPKWTLLISISVAIILFWQYLGRLLLLHIFLFQSLLPELSHRCTEKKKKKIFFLPFQCFLTADVIPNKFHFVWQKHKIHREIHTSAGKIDASRWRSSHFIASVSVSNLSLSPEDGAISTHWVLGDPKHSLCWMRRDKRSVPVWAKHS